MSTNEKNINKDSNLFSLLIFRFVPYWPLFVVLLVIAVAGAWVYLQFATPVYQASANILMKDEYKGVDNPKGLDALDVYSSRKIIENETMIIQSKPIMVEVVKDLDLYANVYEDGKFSPSPAYTSSPIIIKAKDPDAIGWTDKVYFKYNQKGNTVSFDSLSYPLDQWVKTAYGTLMFSKNPKQEKAPSNPIYFVLEPVSYAAGDLLGNLSVSPVSKLSTILFLQYFDQVPQRAEAILNEILKEYQIATIKEKNQLAINTLAFVDDRIKYLEVELDSIEKKIQHFKANKGVTDISDQGRLYLQNVGNNDQKVADINMQLAALDQVENFVTSKSANSGIIPSTLGVNDPVLSQMLQKLYDTELEYEKIKKTTAENNPLVSSLADQIEKIRPDILANVQSQKQNLIASRNNLTATNSLYSSKIQSLPEKEKELLEISRQQAIKSDIYTFLLKKREEAAYASASNVADSKIVSGAESDWIPVKPKKLFVLIIALGIAMGVGVAIVSTKELLNKNILFRSEIEKFTTLPIASEISKVKSNETFPVLDPDKLFLAEQFRHLRAAIGIYGKKNVKRKILVTSNISGEGKSFISSNLAISLGMAGKKVVLLDFDLRNPKTTSLFQLGKEQKGITDYLKGNCEVYEVIKSTSYENLHIIPSGSAISNTYELLSNKSLDDLFNYLNEVFDMIIVDTSPVDPVTDAYVLSEYCDTTLLVIRHGYTPKSMIQLLDNNNKIKALNNVTIVFNGIKSRGFVRGGGYGFGHGYGYEYVYANDRKKNKQIS